MTNMSSGSKRSWEGRESSYREHKKPREDTRDWRDVHLKTSTGHSASSVSGRRGSNGHRRRDTDHSRRSTSRPRRDRSRRREDQRHDNSPRQYRSRSPRSNGNGRHDSNELEEGEISPRHSPPTAPDPAPAPAPSSSLAPAPSSEPLPDLQLDIPALTETTFDPEAARKARLVKWEAIRARSSVNTSVNGTPAPEISSAVQPPPSSAVSDHITSSFSHTSLLSNGSKADNKRTSLSPSPTPGNDFELAKDDEAESSQRKTQAENSTLDGAVQVSAGDYDPSLDRREDEQRRVFGPTQNEPEVMEVDEEEEEEEEEEDVDDMFAVATTEKKPKKVKKVKKTNPTAPALITTTLDSAADSEGYYSVILAEQLDGGRYQVFSSLGKGMFANVVRARVLQGDGDAVGREVAIKIVRCQESMYKAGLKEVQILNKLMQADPDDKKHIVRLERTFEHRGHLCLVFESLSMNLREVVKRFGKDVGLNIRAVRAYAHQLFLSLTLLKKVGVMHADIKPDNILVNEAKTVLKLCDLGSASDASENEITPYLVSRFYRAPEIILGVPYDPALDIWSMGCTLYELYTGKILFPGRSNNQMLLLMMELKGRFNSKMIKKAKFGDVYFDDMGGFESVERDRVLGTDVVRKVHISKPTRDLRARLMPPASVKMKDDESKLLLSFIDLLDKCLALDPSRRITPREALAHPFIRG
ncbi:kinase-like domain-containing protein [Desarmillaria tabescens]|uniref:non-specific serine/threonine protein kinase n=1 Tax=Armillaria tabescens TaxID=1929756 RepID=A0AA39K8M6_ARMTA|nr:kinase-like domain-containing protein [Desarmillaria tabescens]KAK0455259.1 kinase-like domain-containing protein [Desarmillaria tabescens]